jgi:hypothetical protein
VRTTVALVNTPDDASSAGSEWRRIGDLPSPAGCNNTQVLIGALDRLRRWAEGDGCLAAPPAVLAGGGAGAPPSTQSEQPRSSQSPTPTPTAHEHTVQTPVTDPVNLRPKLEQPLAQHAILAVRLTRARLRDDADLAQTAEEALTKNTDEFGALVESAYGSAAAEWFKQRWFTHVTLLFNYTLGVADKDDSVTVEVRAELAGYTFSLSRFPEEATKQAARASVVRPELETHLDQLLQQTDAYSQGDYGRVFALERGSYAHMPYLRQLSRPYRGYRKCLRWRQCGQVPGVAG